jgi:flagellar motor component MotA
MGGVIAEDSRVNVLIRLVSLVIIALGIGFAVVTSQGAATATLQPEVVPVYYLCSTILMVVGFVGLIAKYRESGSKPQ